MKMIASTVLRRKQSQHTLTEGESLVGRVLCSGDDIAVIGREVPDEVIDRHVAVPSPCSTHLHCDALTLLCDSVIRVDEAEHPIVATHSMTGLDMGTVPRVIISLSLYATDSTVLQLSRLSSAHEVVLSISKTICTLRPKWPSDSELSVDLFGWEIGISGLTIPTSSDRCEY